MVVYTLEQRVEILRHYFESHGNVAECVRKLRTDFGRREAPSARLATSELRFDTVALLFVGCRQR